ncbi:Uncharacterised protein [Chlamydia abortus]|uniref:hypothetical protein n=1 Tax=Chlamydia abortus TaxID=83555 RepID=UPI00052A3D81|nr:hypothetical protein [Chlamydia abortus]QRR31973.1 hypothetical protein JS522_01420 [Chlamydia abortus]CED80325.1 hypothetical serine rich protein [Chlamydia abortus]CED81285.1 hypothetical serine rich protein [Chlamydia abortus]CEF16731.1 hypothetical serine rich protein [Chlamydia abortus]SGA04912.1 Uncharacterised protein [Chlamydia abortus]
MAGVSGIGGSGGPRNIPPHDHDDDKRSDAHQFGGHNIVYGNEAGEHSPSSVKDRAQLLMQSGFQVHNPEEVASRSSVSQSEGTKSGFFGRMWDAVKGIFGKKTQKESVTEISGPEISGYKKYGRRLPEARAVRTHFQSQEGGMRIDSGDTDIADAEEVAVGELVDIEHSSDAESSSKTSGSPGLAKRVRGWWDYANRKQEEPVDGRVGLSLGELQDMADRFAKMMNETDNESERVLFAQYRDTYEGYIQDMLSSGATSSYDKYSLLDGSFDETASVHHRDEIGEAIFLDSDQDVSQASEADLMRMMDTGHNANSILGDLSPEVQRVLKEAQSMRASLDAGISDNVTPQLRERILSAMHRLLSGIQSILTVIRNSLIALSRLVRSGLRALGEFVRRRGTVTEDHYHVPINDADIYPGARELLTQYTDSSSSDGSEENFVIPRSVVEAWADGIPEVVYMTRVGEGFRVDDEQLAENRDDVVYEEIPVRNFLPRTQEDAVYETMHPRGLGSTPVEDDEVVYEDMSGQQGNTQEEPVYDTPRSSPIYDVPGSASDLYDVPRPFPLLNEVDDQGYMIPSAIRGGGVLGVTPGFGNALVAVSSAAYFDRLIEENDRMREGIWTTQSSADFGLEEARRSYAREGRPLPSLPPLETPPPSPYGNNRVMQLLRQLQSGISNAWKSRRK